MLLHSYFPTITPLWLFFPFIFSSKVIIITIIGSLFLCAYGRGSHIHNFLQSHRFGYSLLFLFSSKLISITVFLFSFLFHIMSISKVHRPYRSYDSYIPGESCEWSLTTPGLPSPRYFHFLPSKKFMEICRLKLGLTYFYEDPSWIAHIIYEADQWKWKSCTVSTFRPETEWRFWKKH